MLINELSKRSGVTIHTLRYYENLGLIHSSRDESITTNNYKNYDESMLEMLEVISEGKEAGFTLSEIKTIFEAYISGSLTSEDHMKLVDKKLIDLDNKIIQLNQMRERLLFMKKEIESGECEE